MSAITDSHGVTPNTQLEQAALYTLLLCEYFFKQLKSLSFVLQSLSWAQQAETTKRRKCSAGTSIVGMLPP
ncbi:hypothetical protein Clacol_007818 [Clathrus columnatus]|uniref:Uncharacterized protein n=1 Tax=Clathrus columnatus TaxID=1419009 RepID=A0AAV5AJ69_9AGAM|nr:hypothetical protein Clacol_007818 [Clathrus columnatus]